MADKFLYETLDSASELGFLKKEIPDFLKDNLNPKFELRPYQIEAFARFFHCIDNDFPGKDKKIVLLSDEAHHINTRTKTQREMFESWENTVERIFTQNEDNLLLEFTATLDYTNQYIVEKYRNKILYRYDLRQFRNDGYSKDVYIVQADFVVDIFGNDTTKIVEVTIGGRR